MTAKKKSKNKTQNRQKTENESDDTTKIDKPNEVSKTDESLETIEFVENGEFISPWCPTSAPSLEFKIVNENEISRLNVTYLGSLFFVSSNESSDPETVNLITENSPGSIIRFTVHKESEDRFIISSLKYPGSGSTRKITLVAQ